MVSYHITNFSLFLKIEGLHLTRHLLWGSPLRMGNDRVKIVQN